MLSETGDVNAARAKAVQVARLNTVAGRQLLLEPEDIVFGNGQFGANGAISPVSMEVASGTTATFTLQPQDGYVIETASGCGGQLDGATYTTGPVTADCGCFSS